MRGGLGWQKEDTHLLALHEPVRHELPRSDPASLVGHVDSLAMLLKALAALRSSTRSLPRSLARSLPCWGKLRSFFLAFFQTPQQGISTLLPRPESPPAFRRRRAEMLVFPKCWIWKCSSGNFFWKRPGNLCPVLVSRQNQCTPSRAPRRETYSRGSPIWSFSRARKTPSFGGKKLSTQNQVLYTPPAVGAPETERQRVSDVT